jgi:hypothetical protein
MSSMTSMTSMTSDMNKLYNVLGSYLLPVLAGIVKEYATDIDIFSNSYAFAVRMPDGSVVTWGHARYGGDSSVVQAKLNIQF